MDLGNKTFRSMMTVYRLFLVTAACTPHKIKAYSLTLKHMQIEGCRGTF